MRINGIKCHFHGGAFYLRLQDVVQWLKDQKKGDPARALTFDYLAEQMDRIDDELKATAVTAQSDAAELLEGHGVPLGPQPVVDGTEGIPPLDTPPDPLPNVKDPKFKKGKKK